MYGRSSLAEAVDADISNETLKSSVSRPFFMTRPSLGVKPLRMAECHLQEDKR
jgi:hypothetical protein